MENLRRWREPVAVVLLVASGVRLLAGIAAVPVLASGEAYGSFAVSALFGAAGVADTVLLLAAAVAAAACLFAPPTRHGRTIAAVAVIETVAAVVVSLVFGLMGLTAESIGRGVEAVQLMAALVLPSVAVVLLLGLLRAAPVAVTAPASAADPASVAPSLTSSPTPESAPPAPPSLSPGWQPEQATGMVWTTAGEAAAGAPASNWPAASGTVGWQPIPGTPDVPPANRSS
jgi:hypothetical protein